MEQYLGKIPKKEIWSWIEAKRPFGVYTIPYVGVFEHTITFLPKYSFRCLEIEIYGKLAWKEVLSCRRLDSERGMTGWRCI